MKKSTLFFAIMLLICGTISAQWVNDPVNNTFVANGSDDAGEIYLSTNSETGDTYVQWCDGDMNGWLPTLQRLDIDGNPQWGEQGITLNHHNFNSWSQGVSMAATTDNAVVSFFGTANEHAFLVKINADGTFAWGEQGVDFGISSATRTELVAGNDGGVWACVMDYDNTYLRYVNADGTLNPMITIGEAGVSCIYSKLVAGLDNVVFITYEKIGSGSGWYVDKQIWVAGYYTDGTMVSQPEQLMASNTFGMTYIHNAVPDGLGGGYAYIQHSGINQVFNVYVFHFDANGHSTIADPNGTSVHSVDPANYYGAPYATVDPVSHDIILIYSQTDSYNQIEDRIFMNRITMTGERLWGEGILIGDNTGTNYYYTKIDAYPNGNGLMVSYFYGAELSHTYEAIGYDMEGNRTWQKQLNSVSSKKIGSENSTGFHNGQNILVWTECNAGILKGQNIDTDGNMGPVEHPSCLPPTNFEGAYQWNEDGTFGVALPWQAPETEPVSYLLYRYDIVSKEDVTIEIPSSETAYFDEMPCGSYLYQLTAVYEDCESEYALTPDGQDKVIVEVTGIAENDAETIIKITNVYNMAGQAVRCHNLEELSEGVYIIQGTTENGAMVSKKIVVNKR